MVYLLRIDLLSVSAQQDVVLTMTSGEQCFGSRVTLLCTHPDPFADSVKYIQQTINWAEDGTVIDFTDPSGKRFTPTRLNSTASTLSFTVTEEDYRDREITYACFLVLNNANRDREESKAITMDALGEYTSLLLLQKLLIYFTHRPFVLFKLYWPQICIRTSYIYTLTYICR